MVWQTMMRRNIWLLSFSLSSNGNCRMVPYHLVGQLDHSSKVPQLRCMKQLRSGEGGDAHILGHRRTSALSAAPRCSLWKEPPCSCSCSCTYTFTLCNSTSSPASTYGCCGSVGPMLMLLQSSVQLLSRRHILPTLNNARCHTRTVQQA